MRPKKKKILRAPENENVEPNKQDGEFNPGQY